MLIPLNTLINKYNPEIKGIIHLGAHMLEEKEAYDEIGVTNVLWVEGNPELVEKAQPLLQGTPQKLYNALISDVDGEKVTFNIANNGQSSSILKWGKHSQYYPNIVYEKSIEATTITLKSLLDANNESPESYNFLNIDLQGVELKALKGLKDYIDNIDYIYTEVNSGEVYEGNDLIWDIDSYLSQHGFERVETHFTDAEWGDAFYIKNKKKTTQIVIHAMPNEIDELEVVLDNLILSSEYLEPKDWVSIRVDLNLSPSLINWSASSISKEYFTSKFELFKEKCSWASEVIFNTIEDDSIQGTTAQKREAIKESYDQFIFLDCDIFFPAPLLKYMLETSYQVRGNYFITPQTVKL